MPSPLKQQKRKKPQKKRKINAKKIMKARLRWEKIQEERRIRTEEREKKRRQEPQEEERGQNQDLEHDSSADGGLNEDVEKSKADKRANKTVTFAPETKTDAPVGYLSLRNRESTLQQSHLSSRSVDDDFDLYTTKVHFNCSRELCLCIRRRAVRLMSAPVVPRKGVKQCIYSVWPTKAKPMKTLDMLVKKFGIDRSKWTYIGNVYPIYRRHREEREQMFRVIVTRSTELPTAGRPWATIFSPKAIKANRPSMFHSLSKTEMVRLILLAAHIEQDPTVRHEVHSHMHVAMAQTKLIVRAYENPEVFDKLKKMLQPEVMERIKQEIKLIEETDIEFEGGRNVDGTSS